MKLQFRYTLVMLAVSISFHPQIAVVRAADEPEILTPPPAPQPRINGAKVFGVRPGNPLLYTIAATGRRSMEFSATNLPGGLPGWLLSGLIDLVASGLMQDKAEQGEAT